jgi:hypothetical protein
MIKASLNDIRCQADLVSRDYEIMMAEARAVFADMDAAHVFSPHIAMNPGARTRQRRERAPGGAPRDRRAAASTRSFCNYLHSELLPHFCILRSNECKFGQAVRGLRCALFRNSATLQDESGSCAFHADGPRVPISSVADPE